MDFQLCNYNSPTMDLLYFFNTSLTEDTLVANRDRLLDEYLKCLSSTMSRLGCRTAAPSRAELEAAMQKYAIVGMIACFAVLPMMLVDKSEVKDLGEIFGEEEGQFSNPAYAGKSYRRIMVKRLPKFDEMGLLDA